MAKVDLPERWEDWASWALALWLLISPWALGFWMEGFATRDAVIAGAVLLALEVVTLSTFGNWEEWANVLVGAWLVVSTFVLPITSVVARLNFVIVGAIVVVLALFELRDLKRRATAETLDRPQNPPPSL